MRRLVLIVAVVLCAGASTPAALAAETFAGPGNGEPGEIFVAESSAPGTGDPIQLSVDCNPSGTSTVGFSASGSALANEFGTFEESGSFTFGPQLTVDPFGPNTGPVQSLAADFSLDAGSVTATGTKTLDPDLSGTASCRPVPDAPAGCTGVAVDATIPFTYQVSFSTGDRERGSGVLRVSLTQLDCGGVVSVVGQLEQDFVDVAASEPTQLFLDPVTAVNPVGAPHTVTATVEDARNAPVAGAVVNFTVTGAVAATETCASGADGTCSVTFPGAPLPGTAAIAAYVDANGNGAQDAGEATASATKVYALPASTVGKAEGGGRVGDVSFAFEAKSDARAAKGACVVTDASALVRIRCLDVVAYVQQGNHATFFGRADVDGVAATYRIDAVDNGDSGRGRDTFQIQTSTGYAAGGILTEGNVQVR
ncbi:MAG: hypothetical protein QOK22_1920 [Gaiellaceae bacterium]|nr:hypothetical protein [Gaiellaceae bacterium]